MSEDRESRIDRELGALDARMKSMELTFMDHKKEFQIMRDDIRVIRDAMLEARGSWKFLLGLVGFSATAGALLMQLATWLWPR